MLTATRTTPALARTNDGTIWRKTFSGWRTADLGARVDPAELTPLPERVYGGLRTADRKTLDAAPAGQWAIDREGEAWLRLTLPDGRPAWTSYTCGKAGSQTLAARGARLLTAHMSAGHGRAGAAARGPASTGTVAA